MKVSSSLQNSKTPALKSTPLYALRKAGNTWELTFAGNPAQIKDHPGMKYVAYLLLNPPPEPLFGLDLASKVQSSKQKRDAITEIVHPYTGETVVVQSNARIQERNLGLDDAETMRWVLRKQNELEAMLEDKELIEPVRAEIHQELNALTEYEKMLTRPVLNCAQKIVRIIRQAIRRLHKRLLGAVDLQGFPNPVLQDFAAHLQQHLIEPSSSYTSAAARRQRDEAAGCFTYQPPAGVVWNR